MSIPTLLPAAPAAVLALLVVGSPLAAQGVDRIPLSLLQEVMPAAERFGAAEGDPPVRAAYGPGPEGEALLGWVFLTSDLPPERFGYSGPIEALVGMRSTGTLTGVRVIDYYESYRSSMGDFLRRPGFQEQFAGKHITDAFHVGDDVDGISRVSISVRALSRGVRDAARKVAAAYGAGPALPTSTVLDIGTLSWFEMRRTGFVERIQVTEPGEGSVGISLVYVGSERLGARLLGEDLYARALEAVERRGGADHVVLYALDGPRLRLFVREGWAWAQDADTVEIPPADIVNLGLPSGGLVATEATLVGLMLLRGDLDIGRPFTMRYRARGGLGVHAVEYRTSEARLRLAEEAARAEAPSVAAGDAPPDSGPPAGRPGASAPPEPPIQDDPTFRATRDETLLERTIATTSWARVALVLGVVALAAAAFAAKRARGLRWASLAATLLLLGWVDGGFLSISHVTSGIGVGPSVYFADLPLLLLVGFTVVTTLVWGRVFCGFLCPFGALQDVLDKVVPRRLRRSLRPSAHGRALKAKYVVLGVILVPALAGSQVSLYQYFEPFGTVFFLSRDVLLWTIAGAFLLASAVVPRFYCRYACPLGAFLAIVSFVSLRRIRRVEQCRVCKVCEQSCPTGAIRGPRIDFHECVRCNECEALLLERRGACRHDMDDIRPRLVQLRVAGAPATEAERA